MIATNIFHRAVAFGPPKTKLPKPVVEGRLIVNGETRACAPAAAELATRLCGAARVLGAIGERLRAGDRLITGSVVQVPIGPGDDVIANFGALGHVRLVIAAGR